MENKVVYQHRRLDNNKIFYIGMGDESRSNNKSNRNIHWKRIVSKCGYKIEIVSKNLTTEEANEIEKYLIKYYGRKDLGLGELANMTDGGPGVFNPNEYVKKDKQDFIGNINKGKKLSNETINKIKKTKKIKMYNKQHIVLNQETGIFFYSINEAAYSHNINKKTLFRQLTGISKNKTNLIITQC